MQFLHFYTVYLFLQQEKTLSLDAAIAPVLAMQSF